MLRIKKISEMIGKHVYTSDADYFGQIEEVNLAENKIESWRVRAGAGFMSNLGGARGVIIPHQFVKAIGDVFIVSSSAFKMGSKEELEVPSETGELA